MPEPKKSIRSAVDAVKRMREAAKKAAEELAEEREKAARESHPKG